MKSQEFEQVNLLMRAGENPDCNDLPISRCLDSFGHPSMVAKFQLLPEEIERVLETGELWVSIRGYVWPPILPSVYHPFDELEYKIPEGLPVIPFREQMETVIRNYLFAPNVFHDDNKWNEFQKFISTALSLKEVAHNTYLAYAGGEEINALDCFEKYFSSVITEEVKQKLYMAFDEQFYN